MTSTSYHHIEIDDTGVPWIAGTKIKVVEVALDRIAYEWDADEIRNQHPQLSLAQIHSALACYYDHREVIDSDIERRIRTEERFFHDHAPSAIVQQKLLQAKSAR